MAMAHNIVTQCNPNLENAPDEDVSEVKIVNFGCIPVDTMVKKYISIENTTVNSLTYRVSNVYVLNSVDRVFKVTVMSGSVNPGDSVNIRIVFKPNIVGQSFTEYFLVDDSSGDAYRLTVTGKCNGPNVSIDRKKIVFRVCKNVSEQRKAVINMVNKSSVDTTYQWYMPACGQGCFQISTGNCGLIRACENITTTVTFTGTALGVYTAELVCLILNQEPLFLGVFATVVLPGNPLFCIQEHSFEKNWKQKSRYVHLMENSLNRLSCVPSASVFERYLDFGMGSVADVTKNISQSLCVTNHEEQEGYIQWMPDPDNIFIVDPIASIIPPNESRLFTVRFRPKIDNEVYGYLMCGDYQYKCFINEEELKLKHTVFRIPCTGNTWLPCTEWLTEWDCPTEVILPPTVPTRTTFANFMLSNKYDVPMHFKFYPPYSTNFVVMPICGIVPSHGWQIISVALEPNCFGDYCEAWDLIINRVQRTRISFTGNAELSQVEVMSHGYHPGTHAMLEFPPTITGCTNYCTSYLHNLTRMEIHIRVLCRVDWLGADEGGSIVLPPKEIIYYHWWFFPKLPDKVYETTITLSCVCLIDGRPVGEPSEVYIAISGFSELPDLRILPKQNNLHDIVVGETLTFPLTLYNNGSCHYTSKLYHLIDGMGDDFSSDRLEIDSSVNCLKPSNHCEVRMTVTPGGAGSRELSIKYTVLFRSENGEIEEIQPKDQRICIIWYDGIYPTLKVKRTLSNKCPVILSNHCVWNIVNVEELNQAFVDCRPNIPLMVNIFAPDLCIRNDYVELVFVMGCVYQAPVPWHLRREKICECEMIEVQVGTSLYEMKHNCIHRSLVELYPLSGIVSPEYPNLLFLKFNYSCKGINRLCYVMTMPNQRTIYIYVHIHAFLNTRGLLTPLRRPMEPDYLAFLDCGRVPINNLDPVIRIVWLYNPTDVFTTWRLLRGNTVSPNSVIRCLLFFAEVPPLGKLAIPFAFMPMEMIDYEVVFLCSFGYETVKILVKGQGGLPNCIETRLDMPYYVERVIREAHRKEVVYLSVEHLTIPIMPTHSLSRDIISISNDTDHVMRFIWLPERIANILNVVMTPCWGVVQPKSAQWITMTVYTLQEPATFTTTVACEILDLTARRKFQQNDLLRRNKMVKCDAEFIITEEGVSHPEINDSPPYVLELEKPQPMYLAMTVSISSKGQRDGYPRMLLRQMFEQPPSYDLLSADLNDYVIDRPSGGNSMTLQDILRIIDGILWDAMHSKMFRNQIDYYSKEEIPVLQQVMKVLDRKKKSKLSPRVTSGICDAIVNKAVFHTYGLNPKQTAILEAE